MIYTKHVLDLKSYYEFKFSMGLNSWLTNLHRLQQEINLNRVSETTVSDALRALVSLKSTLHEYNRRIAEVSSCFHIKHCMASFPSICLNGRELDMPMSK